MEELGQMWGLYEEWQQGFTEKADQDWITFRLLWNDFWKHFVRLCVPPGFFQKASVWLFCRSKTYLFEEFLFAWQDRLRKLEQPTVMSVKLQGEVDKYKVAQREVQCVSYKENSCETRGLIALVL